MTLEVSIGFIGKKRMIKASNLLAVLFFTALMEFVMISTRITTVALISLVQISIQTFQARS